MPRHKTARQSWAVRSKPDRQVQKCGCTLIKNLLWKLQFRALHPNPGRVHDDGHLLPRIAIDGATAVRIERKEMLGTIPA